MESLNYQVHKGDIPAIKMWLAKRIADLPSEAFSDFQFCLSSRSVASFSGFISRWLDAVACERLYTTIRVARHRKRKSRKKNLMISPEAYDRLKSLASGAGFRSVTAYVER